MIGIAISVTMESRQESENIKITDPNSIVTFRIRTLMYKDKVLDIV